MNKKLCPHGADLIADGRLSNKTLNIISELYSMIEKLNTTRGKRKRKDSGLRKMRSMGW